MTGEEYIRGVLVKYAVSCGPDSPAIKAANKIAPTLTAWAGEHLVDLRELGQGHHVYFLKHQSQLPRKYPGDLTR